MGSEVRVDPAALSAAHGELRSLGRGIAAETGAVRAAADGALEGAGELAADLSLGASAFRMSWTAVLEVLAESAELAGGAVDAARAEYLRRDAALSQTFR